MPLAATLLVALCVAGKAGTLGQEALTLHAAETFQKFWTGSAEIPSQLDSAGNQQMGTKAFSELLKVCAKPVNILENILEEYVWSYQAQPGCSRPDMQAPAYHRVPGESADSSGTDAYL